MPVQNIEATKKANTSKENKYNLSVNKKHTE